MNRVIHEKCGTQIGWHKGGKKGFVKLDGTERRPGEFYFCPACGVIPPSQTKTVTGAKNG